MGNTVRHQLGNICGGASSKETEIGSDQPIARPKEEKKKEKKSKKNKKLKNGHLDTITEDETPNNVPGENIEGSQIQGKPEEPLEIQSEVQKDDSSTIPVIIVETVSESFASPETDDVCDQKSHDSSSFSSSTEEDTSRKSIIDCCIEPVNPEILEIGKADEIFDKAFSCYGKFSKYANKFKDAILEFQIVVEPEKRSTNFMSLWSTYEQLTEQSKDVINSGNTVSNVSGNLKNIKAAGFELLQTIDTVKPLFNKCIDDAEDIDAIECTKEKMLEGEETMTTGKFSVPGKYRRNMKLLQRCTKQMTETELETNQIVKCLESHFCHGALSETMPEIKEQTRESIIFPEQTVTTQDTDDIFLKLEEASQLLDDKEVLNLQSENLLQSIDIILNDNASNSNCVYNGNDSQDSNQVGKENTKCMASDFEDIFHVLQTSQVPIDSTLSQLIKNDDKQCFNDMTVNHHTPQVHNEESHNRSYKDCPMEKSSKPELKTPITKSMNDSGHVTISSEEFDNSEYSNMSFDSVSSTDLVTPDNGIKSFHKSQLNNSQSSHIHIYFMTNDEPYDETNQIDTHQDDSFEKDFVTTSQLLTSDLNSLDSTSVYIDDSEESSITFESLIQPKIEDEVYSPNPNFLGEESLQSASLGEVNMEKTDHVPYNPSDVNAIIDTSEERVLQNDSIPPDQLNDPPNVKGVVTSTVEEHLESSPINIIDIEEELDIVVTYSVVEHTETTPINDVYLEEVDHVSPEMCTVSAIIDTPDEALLQNDSIPFDQLDINAKEVDVALTALEEFINNDVENELCTSLSHAHSNENHKNDNSNESMETYFPNNSVSSIQQIKAEIGTTHPEIVESVEQPIEVNEVHTSPIEEFYSADISIHQREDEVDHTEEGSDTVGSNHEYGIESSFNNQTTSPCNEICRSIIVPVERDSVQILHNISHTILVNSDNYSPSEVDGGHTDENSRKTNLHTIEVLFRENRTDYTDHLIVEPCSSDMEHDILPEELTQTFVIKSIPETPQEKELVSSHDASVHNTPPAELDIDEMVDHNTLEYGNYVFVDPTTGDIQVMRNRSRSLDSLCSMASSRSSISRFGSFEFVTDFEINIAEKNQDLLKLK